MNTANTCNLTSEDRYSAVLSDCRAADEAEPAAVDAGSERREADDGCI